MSAAAAPGTSPWPGWPATGPAAQPPDYRLHTYRGRKGETKAFTWSEYRDLLIAAHRQLPGGVIVLVWDSLNVHLHAELRAFTSAQEWLRVFQLPSCAPDLNPVEGIWSVLKRGALANLAVTSFAHLLQVIRHGLKKIQYQPGLTGWLAHKLNAPGKFLISAPEYDTPRRARAYLVTDQAVSDAAAHYAGQRPELDEVSRHAIGASPAPGLVADPVDEGPAADADPPGPGTGQETATAEDTLWFALCVAP